jgi:hypothetical protein
MGKTGIAKAENRESEHFDIAVASSIRPDGNEEVEFFAVVASGRNCGQTAAMRR